MQVFKAFFKVIKKNIPQMLIYFGIFMIMSLIFLNAGVGEQMVEFQETKPNIAIVNEDNSQLSEQLIDYLSNHTKILEFSNDEDKIRDALFFREITYVLYIPEDFGLNFAVSNISLDRFMIVDSFSTAYLDEIISKYLRTYEVFKTFMPELSSLEISSKTLDVLGYSTNVEMMKFDTVEALTDNSMYYFNYFAYSLLSIILLGISSFMITFKQIDLRRRNNCSPISAMSMNFQLIAGNLIFAFAVWGIMYLIAFFLFGFKQLEPKALHYAINTFSYMLVCLTLSFLVSNLVSSKNAQAAIVNVLALGLSFISGVFVPQFLLGDFVLRIASFAPTYWFVRANWKINVAFDISKEGLGLIQTEVLMQLGFSVALLLASFVILRFKRTSGNL